VRKKTPLKYLAQIKPLDILVIALSLTLTLIVALAVYSGKMAASSVIVRSSDKTWIFPLDAEAQIIVAGPIGETRVRINKGRAAIVASPCAGQTCVAAGELHKNGQWAACLPNKVFLLVEGTGDAIDAASY
jgi:hypothetical protein